MCIKFFFQLEFYVIKPPYNMADSNCNILWKSERVYRCHSFHFNVCRGMCAPSDICTRKIWACVYVLHRFFFLFCFFPSSSLPLTLRSFENMSVSIQHTREYSHTHRHNTHAHAHSLRRM